jgi:hypothetical protein
MSSKIDTELENLRNSEQIRDWSVSLGYGEAEYTIEFKASNIPNLKLLAKRLTEKYGAHNFTKHTNNGEVAIKFVVTL